MNKTLYLLSLFSLLLAALAGLLFSLSFTRQPNPPLDKPVVAATIFPLADITRQVAGPHFTVSQLIPSSSDPHSFNLTPQQIRDLSRAQTIFAIGHGLDDHIVSAALKLQSYPVVLVDQNIKLRPFRSDDTDTYLADPANLDPHYWLTAPNAKEIASTVANELVRIDPANASDYQSNLTTYQRLLDELEQNLQQQAATAAQPNFIAVHDAWSYFADHYRLSLIATYEPIEGQPPTISDLRHLQQLIRQYQIKTFFTEPKKTTSASLRLMQQDFGLTIKTLDDLGGVDPNDSYLKLMLRNMQALVTVNK